MKIYMLLEEQKEDKDSIENLKLEFMDINGILPDVID